MKTIAQIQNNRVVNVSVWEQVPQQPDMVDITDQPGVGVGWGYGNGVFTAPPVPSPVVPQSVTRRQARQALLIVGKLSQVQPAIDAIADATQRGLIQIEWDDSQTFERQRPSLIALATALGMDDAELDALFTQAAAL